MWQEHNNNENHSSQSGAIYIIYIIVQKINQQKLGNVEFSIHNCKENQSQNLS